MDDRDRARARRHLLDAHHETIADVCEAGRSVATSWTEATVTDPHCVTDPLTNQLGDDLPEQLLDGLETSVTAAGHELQGTPVPAPPYFVVTSRGPLCRGTLDDGRRLVILCELFSVERRPRTYRFIDPSPATCLRVRLRNE
jgi:hypothetical protein